MAKDKDKAPDLFESLFALEAPLGDATVEGLHSEFVRLALLNVAGAIGHVRSALKQDEFAAEADRNTAERAAEQEAQRRKSLARTGGK